MRVLTVRETYVDAILHALSIVEDDLSAGAVAVVETAPMRLRHLPIDD